MKSWAWIVLLFPLPPLVARDQRFGGYILDAAAFRSIDSYCIDAHNLPPREAEVVNQFLSREGNSAGLLAKLPWHRVTACGEGATNTIVRAEFPSHHLPSLFLNRDVNGVLFVFRAGSPSPIYETREVLMTNAFEISGGRFATEALERNALYFLVQILIHDWQKLSENLRAAAD